MSDLQLCVACPAGRPALNLLQDTALMTLLTSHVTQSQISEGLLADHATNIARLTALRSLTLGMDPDELSELPADLNCSSCASWSCTAIRKHGNLPLLVVPAALSALQRLTSLQLTATADYMLADCAMTSLTRLSIQYGAQSLHAGTCPLSCHTCVA